MVIPAGKLTRLLTISRRVDGEDELNQPSATWELVGQVWAQPRTQAGLSRIREGLTQELNAYSFRIRYNTGFDSGMRVETDGLIFDIKQIAHDLERHDWTDLICATGASNG